MEKKRPKRLALNRETTRELRRTDTRWVVGGDGDGGSQVADSCVVLCSRVHIPGG
jgi:hypothetical protein